MTIKKIFLMMMMIGNISAKDGDGTFYGSGGAGDRGACMLRPGFNGVPVTCAINPNDYHDGNSCGKCIKLTGKGQGAGMTPIFGPVFATIDNLCPECKDGDVDLGLGGDGRWRVQWDFISCDEARRNHRSMLRSNISVFNSSSPFMKWSLSRGNYF